MINFRKAQIKDAETYVDILINSRKETYENFKKGIDLNKAYKKEEIIKAFLETLKNKNVHAYMIEYKNEIAGILEFGEPISKNLYQDDMNGYGEIRTLHIKKEFQRLGIGKLAIEFALEQCKKYKYIFVWTKKENQNAIDFYEKQGFQYKTSSEKRSDGIPSIVMERRNEMNLFLWYPKCSTCKKAYQSLLEQNITIECRDIKENNPTKEELQQWWEKSGVELKKFFNTSGLIYKELNLKEKLPTMTTDEQLKLLESNGMLVKRPILITKDKVIIGYKEKEYELV